MQEPRALESGTPSADARTHRRNSVGQLPQAEILLAAPRGFCAGVRRAIDAVLDALRVHGKPVFVRRAIVHNLEVVHQLEMQGAVFVEELAKIPAGAVVVLSAHGVAPDIAREARERGLTVYDAVCPLVAKVHREVGRHFRDGRHVVLIGHQGHPEIDGTLGHLPPAAASLVRSASDVPTLPFSADTPMAYAVQTTFSLGEAAQVIAALESRFDDLAPPPASDICYATTNRQNAVAQIAERADAVIVAGARISSNARRLAEVAAQSCRQVQLVARAYELDWTRLPAAGGVIGVTAAASTPESSVREIVRALSRRYRVDVRELDEGAAEKVVFKKVPVGRPRGPLPHPS